MNEQKQALDTALYFLRHTQPFYGCLLQELTLRYNSLVPTAGLIFDKTHNQFEIYINPSYFLSLSTDERVAVLHHELLHFTNKHLFRLPFLEATLEDRQLYNMAGDMAINQYIKNLPQGCIDVKDWVDQETRPFPTYQSMEIYYELLKANKEPNKDKFESYRSFDEHNWEKVDEETKQKMLNEAKTVLKRTIEKTVFSGINVPHNITDLLNELQSMSFSINYKQILRQVVKRTLSGADRMGSWSRPNKRYGICAPGTKNGLLPQLTMYCDTSGSISHREINNFLSIISGFLKTGSRNCSLALWHTEIYTKRQWKLNDSIKENELSNGGTDVSCVLSDIIKTKPNLSVIYTDGYYESSSHIPNSEILWIISSGGNENHGLKHIGKTIFIEGLENG